MLVPSMSDEEMVVALLADLDALHRKLAHIEREADRYVIKTKKLPFIRAYEYVTPKSKNKWIIILEKKSKKETLYSLINCHYDQIGFRTAMITPDREVIFIIGHLFDRFEEREKLPLADITEKVKDFFFKNPLIQIERLPASDSKVVPIFCRTDTGVLLGYETDLAVYCKTYVSDEMLFEDQQILSAKLQEEIEKYLKERKLKRTPFSH